VLVASEQGPSATPSLVEAYAETTLKLRAMQNMTSSGPGLTLLVPGNTGLHLHQKSNNAGSLNALQLKLDQLGAKLRLPMGTTMDSPMFLEGLRAVKQRNLRHMQHLVEEQSFKYRLLFQKLAQVESGNNAQKLKKSVNAAKT